MTNHLASIVASGTFDVVGPVIAAAASIIVAVLSAVWSAASSRAAGRRAAEAQRNLEELKTELAERSAERDARRDYEYEARKRLYEACEPLLFKMMERSSEAYYRIVNLAQAARNGMSSQIVDGSRPAAITTLPPRYTS